MGGGEWWVGGGGGVGPAYGADLRTWRPRRRSRRPVLVRSFWKPRPRTKWFAIRISARTHLVFGRRRIRLLANRAVFLDGVGRTPANFRDCFARGHGAGGREALAARWGPVPQVRR